MKKKILIDASYPENTQVAVVLDNKLIDLDYISSSKKITKGNIYLAKITRIEPSLQAAFIDYGPEKHGFIPFSEIDPSYYDIPSKYKKQQEINEEAEQRNETEEDTEQKPLEVEESDAEDEYAFEKRKQKNAEQYKIQEVLKRNQILLVQVLKEERGNKGAAFTTYISLAGRYCVLMPNSGFRGGVSKKIEDVTERKRLKSIIGHINEFNATNLIIRTVGKGKTEEQIQQDYNYLARLWNDIREKTLSSNAPAFVHAEDDILKKTIRDLYDDDTSEILIQGESAYKEAKSIADVMSDSGSIVVNQYLGNTNIFTKFKVDEQIANLYNPIAHTESGSYIVINHTEALIAIDVNSGKSTSEKNLESMALRTNLDAAKEIARQIRLRDLSGIIVVDFIDMSELKNRKLVERTLKDLLYKDKAKVQVGYISSLGLLEISRQRLKPSFLESTTVACSKCLGRGVVRSSDTNAVMILKTIEGEIANSANKCKEINVYAAPETVLFILNYKREELKLIEQRYSISLYFHQDAKMSSDGFAIETVESSVKAVPANPEPRAFRERKEAPKAAQAADEGKPNRNRNRRRRRRKPVKNSDVTAIKENGNQEDSASSGRAPENSSENTTSHVDSSQ